MTRWRGSGLRRRLAGTMLGIALTWSLNPAALAEVLRSGGELGYDLRLEDRDGMSGIVEHNFLLRLSAAGYVHEPWLATYQGSVGFNARQTDSKDGPSDSDLITGDLSLRLFPLSRFPLELFAERSDSSVDTDLMGFDLVRTRYGLHQQYTSETGTAYRLRYERNEYEQDAHMPEQPGDRTHDIGDLLQASFDKAAGAHRFTFDGNISRIDAVDSPDLTETSYGAFRHSYRPSARLNAEDLFSYHATRIAIDGAEFDNDVYQLTSYAFWRPETERPLRVSSTLRAVTRGGAGPARGNAGNSSLGATYEWNRNWQLIANAGISTTDVNDQVDTNTFQSAGAVYTSDDRSFAGGALTWFGQADVGNTTDPEGTVQSVALQIGYGFNRGWPFNQSGLIELDVRQNVVESVDTEAFAAVTLLSSAALSYHHRHDNLNSMLRASVSDSRTDAQGEDLRRVAGDFQIVNLQLSVDRKLSPGTALIGNVTVQATREYRPNSGLMQDHWNGEWRPTATADLTFQARPLFGVPNLSFRSTLRFVSDAYLPVLDEPAFPEGRDDRRWENRLEYFVGRLQCRLVARLAEINGERQSFVLLQVRRFFGDL